jgi:hypothetical protein
MGEHGELVTKRVLKSAIEKGDMTAARLILDRICPPRRGRPVRVALPKLDGVAGILAANEVLIEAVASGELTGEEAAPLLDALAGRMKLIETTEIAERLRAVEEKLGVQK